MCDIIHSKIKQMLLSSERDQFLEALYKMNCEVETGLHYTIDLIKMNYAKQAFHQTIARYNMLIFSAYNDIPYEMAVEELAKALQTIYLARDNKDYIPEKYQTVFFHD